MNTKKAINCLLAGALLGSIACSAVSSATTAVPSSSPTVPAASTAVFRPTSSPTSTSRPVPTPSPSPTLVPGPNDYITVAQLNLWFFGPGCYGGFEAFNCSGKRNTNLIPALGTTYESADPDVIRQQIEWAAEYGVDAFSIEWATPREISGSIENILDDNFLKAPNLNKVRWCIFYDLVLRVQQTPGLQVDLSSGMDFDDPDVYDTFVADFDHFAEKYFSQPEYLKIDDRPVLYVWGTWNATGRYVEAFQAAREKAAARGFDVYIVGDIIRADRFDPALASVYDASTNFVLFVPGSPPAADVGEATINLDKTLTRWENQIAGMKVKGREEPVVLQPGFAPQYDDRLFREVNYIESPTYIPALSQDQVRAMATMLRQHAQPAGSEGWKLIWLNTWNNWAETTTFEPTAASGTKYPAGNYQFDMVEVIREIFGQKTFSNQPIVINRRPETLPRNNIARRLKWFGYMNRGNKVAQIGIFITRFIPRNSTLLL